MRKRYESNGPDRLCLCDTLFSLDDVSVGIFDLGFGGGVDGSIHNLRKEIVSCVQ